MIWDFYEFIKKILINVGVHVCWVMIYVLIEMLAHGTESTIISEICFFTFEHKDIFFVLAIFIVYYILQIIYSKNPCETKTGKIAYWLISIVQTILLSTMLSFW